ncbi:MAG: EamA family transporter RarD [Gammaproteobacteria bacterium]
MTSPPDPRTGVALALGGFVLWGLFPIYFYLLRGVEASEVLAHRVLGSALLLLLIFAWRGHLAKLWREVRSTRRLGFYALTSALVSANWLIYIWATQNGHVIDASLGYFINPLVSVLLALAFLGERLRRQQWAAVALAGMGVGVLVVDYGAVPWIALSLALSFGGYGLLRKKAGVPAMTGLLVETLLAAPVALGWMVWLALDQRFAFGSAGLQINALLALAGVVTVLPLALFLQSMVHLRLSTVGLIQYVTPTLQFLIGLWLGEPFGTSRMLAFAFIWTALVVFTADALSHGRKSRVAV